MKIYSILSKGLVLAMAFSSSSCNFLRTFRDMYTVEPYNPVLITMEADYRDFYVMRTHLATLSAGLNVLTNVDSTQVVSQEKWMCLEGFSKNEPEGNLFCGSNFRDEGTPELTSTYSCFDTLYLNYHNDILIGRWRKIDEMELSGVLDSDISIKYNTFLILDIQGLVGPYQVIAGCSSDTSITSIEYIYTSDPKPKGPEVRFKRISDYLTYNDSYSYYRVQSDAGKNFKKKIGIQTVPGTFYDLEKLEIVNTSRNEKKPNYELNGVFKKPDGSQITLGWWRRSGLRHRTGKIMIHPQVVAFNRK